MISIETLKYGLIFLLMASIPAYSKDIDYRNIDGNLIYSQDDITSQDTLGQNSLNNVKTKGDNFEPKYDCRKIEENLISSMKYISSENEGLKKNLHELSTLVSTLSVTLDSLLRNQNAFQSKSEKAFMKLEEKLIEDNSNEAKNISQEVSLIKDSLLRNQNAFQSKLEKAFMKLEEKLIEDNSNEAKYISQEVSLIKDLLMSNQDADHSKSEKAYMNLEEKVKKYISEAEKKISSSISSCKERFDATGSLTNSVLDKISSQAEDIKEILKKKEKPSGNNNHSNVQKDYGTNISGMKNSCQSFTKNLLSVAKTLFNTKALTNGPVNNCLNGLFKNINGLSYLKAPYLQGNEVKKFCNNKGGEPFIPRTQEELIKNIAMAIIHTYFWYPINDINREGRVVLYDGTDYGNSFYKHKKWFPFYPNTQGRDCAAVNIFGEGVWHECGAIKHRAFCRL